MTTNKPEVVAVLYRDGSVLTKQECGIAFDTCCNVETPLIRLSYYEALQAECEKLRSRARAAEREYSKVAQTLKGMERVSKVVSDYSDGVCTENNQLRVECEKLRKESERHRSLLEAVRCEIPHRKGSRGNAPGHGHSVPGVWDYDNGALAGKECAWCKVWNEALAAMQETPK